MRKYSIYFMLLATLSIMGCEQEIADLKEPEAVAPPTGSLGTSITMTKFVTIGNSLVAGYQANALFTDGQEESLGKILNQQFTYAGGTSSFNQPNINSVNGYSAAIGPLALGRLILFDPDGSGPRSAGPAASGTPERSSTCPSAVVTPAVPAPYNTADFPTPFTGDKTALNNFGVPGILLAQTLTPLTGGPSTANPAYNPLYARFASNPGTSTIVGDAIAAQPTFFLVEVGNNDVLGYATTGASGAIPLTAAATFAGQYNALINTLLTGPGTLATAKGVVANIPDVTSIPFFFTVLYNAVPLDAATATQVNTGFAGYNAILNALKGPPFNYDPATVDARKVTFAESKTNRILITDETLNNYSDEFDALQGAGAITAEQRAALTPYVQVRQATATDLITLSAGGVLGTCAGGNPAAIYGISVPLGDQYVLIPSEISEINSRIDEFNATIQTAVEGSGGRLALADVNTAFNTFVANKGGVYNGILLTPSITPPYAGFSEDGVHPNGRGYAFLANIFIDAINAKFGSTIPKANITKYRGTRTPITPDKSF